MKKRKWLRVSLYALLTVFVLNVFAFLVFNRPDDLSMAFIYEADIEQMDRLFEGFGVEDKSYFRPPYGD